MRNLRLISCVIGLEISPSVRRTSDLWSNASLWVLSTERFFKPVLENAVCSGSKMKSVGRRGLGMMEDMNKQRTSSKSASWLLGVRIKAGRTFEPVKSVNG